MSTVPRRMPVAFISHGAPDAILTADDAVAQWADMATRIPKPESILVISAHWEARTPTVSLADKPETIHDFSGFPAALHAMTYPAPGATQLARRTADLLGSTGIATALEPDRGLDHGAWVPLTGMYPQADIPVTQLSLIRHGTPAQHLAMGRALFPLRDEGVLILATGSITHNFGWLTRAKSTAEPLPKARMFNDWVATCIAKGDTAALQAYRTAPHGAEAHPTEEHFLPLFVAVGSAGDDDAFRYQPGMAYGGLSMDAYLWGADAQV